MNPTSLYVLIVIFVATLIRSTFGFGEALVAVPLLALRLPVEVAAPLAVLMSVVVAGVVVIQDWRHVHVRSAGGLVLATLVGIPLGLWMLTAANEHVIKITLASIIIAFSAYSLLRSSPIELHHDSRPWLFGCGFLAGVLGGAYGMNGPPLVVYGSLRRWSAQHFRATLQGYFLPASALGLAGYGFTGLLTPVVVHYFLVSLPGTVVAILVGRAVNRRLSGRAFLTYIHGGLIVTGAVLLFQSLR